MYDNKPECENINKEELVHQQSSEELLTAREEIEFLRASVESKNLLINDLENKLIKANQEFKIRNEELGRTLVTGVSFEEAKAVAKQLLKCEKVNSVLVAKLLNILYNFLEEAIELQEADLTEINQNENKVSKQIIANSNKIKQHSEEMYNRYIELSQRFLTFTVNFNKLQDSSNVPPRKNEINNLFKKFNYQ